MRYLLTGVIGLLTLSVFFACQKEISLENGSPAKGSLQSSGGDCLPKTVSGAYLAAKALNDTNYIEVTVNVTTPGPYTIVTDTLNGYAFKATGTFANSGTTTVRLKGSGTPAAAGTDDFTVRFDSSECIISIDVLPAGTGPAVYTLGGSGGACTPFDTTGNLVKDTALDARHTVTVNVNVTVIGPYSITTNTANGYYFSKTGSFTTPGSQQVVLMGQGTPLAAGTNAFTVTAGSLTCTFFRTVTATPPAGCNPNVQGTYTAGTATAAANTVTLTHTYATAGPVTVSTNTVNGYSFGPLNRTATVGSNTITLNATGTPTAAGTNTFTVNFGDGSNCSFTVTVAGVPTPLGNDYFPTTQGSYWNYDDGTGADTFRTTVTGTQVYNDALNAPQTYQRFISAATPTGPFDTAFYRKAANGYYFNSIDTAGAGPDIVFTRSRLDIQFLRNTLTTGATWASSHPAIIFGFPSVVNFNYKCDNANATLTVNSRNYTNVYKIIEQAEVNIGGTGPQPLGDPTTFYYAKGIGLIFVEDDTAQPLQAVRTWVVN